MKIETKSSDFSVVVHELPTLELPEHSETTEKSTSVAFALLALTQSVNGKELASLMRLNKHVREQLISNCTVMREHVLESPTVIYHKDFPKKFLDDFELMYNALSKMPSACFSVGETLKKTHKQYLKIVMEAFVSCKLKDSEKRIDEEKIDTLARNTLPSTDTLLEVPITWGEFGEGFAEGLLDEKRAVKVRTIVEELGVPSYTQLDTALKAINNSYDHTSLLTPHVWLFSTRSSARSLIYRNQDGPIFTNFAVFFNETDRSLLRLAHRVYEVGVNYRWLPAIFVAHSSLQNDPEFKKTYFRQVCEAAWVDPVLLKSFKFPKVLLQDIKVITRCLSRSHEVYFLVPEALKKDHKKEIEEAFAQGLDVLLLDCFQRGVTGEFFTQNGCDRDKIAPLILNLKLDQDQYQYYSTARLDFDDFGVLTATKNGVATQLHDLKAPLFKTYGNEDEEFSVQYTAHKVSLADDPNKIINHLRSAVYEKGKLATEEVMTACFTYLDVHFDLTIAEMVSLSSSGFKVLVNRATRGLLSSDYILDEKALAKRTSDSFAKTLVAKIDRNPIGLLKSNEAGFVTVVARYLQSEQKTQENVPLNILAADLAVNLHKILGITIDNSVDSKFVDGTIATAVKQIEENSFFYEN